MASLWTGYRWLSRWALAAAFAVTKYSQSVIAGLAGTVYESGNNRAFAEASLIDGGTSASRAVVIANFREYNLAPVVSRGLTRFQESLGLQRMRT
jgi:hypothetical protein